MAFPIYDAPNPLDGLLGRFNTDDPTKQARLAQSLALLEAGGPSRVPVSLFQGLGMAGKAGLEAKRQAQKDAQAKLLQDMQLQQFTSQQEEMKRKRTQEEALAGLWKSSMTPGGPGMPANEMDSGMDMGQQAPQFDRNKFIQGLGNIDPMEALKLTQPKEPKYTALGNNLIRTDTQTPTVAITVPEKKNPSSLSQLIAERDNFPRGSPQWNLFEAKIRKETTHAPAASMNVTNVTEKEQSKEYGKSLGEIRAQIQKDAFKAPQVLSNLSRMEQLLQGVDGGRLAPAGKELASFAKSLGINIDPKLGNKEAAQALAVEMALAMRQPGSGATSDKDFENWLATVPSLGKTAEGRKQITATVRAKVERDKVVAKMARDFAAKNGGVITDEFLDQLAEFQAKNPVVARPSIQFLGWEKQ